MLTMTELQHRAPSVFALEPWQQVSSNYRFVPTIEVVNALEERGFVPMFAKQSKTRIEGKQDFTRHIIRFRHSDFALVTDRRELLGVPEIILMNSHDRSSSYKIMMGVFRQVCSNGLIACSEDLGFTVRHSGAKDLTQQVIDASYRIIETAPKVAGKIENWTGRAVSPAKQLAYAASALELRHSPLKIEPEQLLESRRYVDQPQADGSRDVWTTFNVVQENLMKGGIQGQSEKTKKRMKTRAIGSVNEDVKLNRALWTLTEKFAALV